MSWDEPFLPAVTGAATNSGPGGPGTPPQDGAETTLRQQVMEVINDVLTSSDPESEWARVQLRELLVSHPDEPERALLEHLIASRTMTDPPEDIPAPYRSGEAPPVFARGQRRRIQAVLGNRMLLTAFQPIRELPGGNVTGLEALARFVSEDGASADTWFREASAVGLGPDLEIAALQCALSAARDVPPHLFVAFNLSATACADLRVRRLLKNSPLGLERIILEVTGGTTDEECRGLIRALKPLRQWGLRVAVDGSGVGAVSREHILQIHPDVIKLDRTFIEGIGSSSGAAEASALIELALLTGAVLAAEGIENEAELDAVMAFGMAAGQGYLLGRPSVHPLDWSAWIIQDRAAPGGSGTAEDARQDLFFREDKHRR